jgi:hypothetical protein
MLGSIGTTVRFGAPDKTFFHIDMWVSNTKKKSELRRRGMRREGIKSSG